MLDQAIPSVTFIKNPQAVQSIFGVPAYNILNKLINPCCSFPPPGGFGNSRFVGDGSTFKFSAPNGSYLAFVSIDGLIQDPTTYTYIQTTGLLTLDSTPSLGSIILIFFQ